MLNPPSPHPVTGVMTSDRHVRVSAGDVVDWMWPILPMNHPDFDEDRRIPRGWQVVSNDNDSTEFINRVEEIKKTSHPDKDPYKARRAELEKPKPTPVALPDNRNGLLLAAVAELEPGNPEHYAGKGPKARPRVQAVQLVVERMVEEETGSRDWPNWVTRDSIDLATHEAWMSDAD